MRAIKKSKGNWSYFLNYQEDSECFVFVVYVKIRSRKRIKILNSTREKIKNISFKKNADLKYLDLSESEKNILFEMLRGFDCEF